MCHSPPQPRAALARSITSVNLKHLHCSKWRSRESTRNSQTLVGKWSSRVPTIEQNMRITTNNECGAGLRMFSLRNHSAIRESQALIIFLDVVTHLLLALPDLLEMIWYVVTLHRMHTLPPKKYSTLGIDNMGFRLTRSDFTVPLAGYNHGTCEHT